MTNDGYVNLNTNIPPPTEPSKTRGPRPGKNKKNLCKMDKNPSH